MADGAAIGGNGTAVERITYGQNERCSLSRSNFRCPAGLASSDVSWGIAMCSPLVGRAENAQSPIRLWHKEQQSRAFPEDKTLSKDSVLEFGKADDGDFGLCGYRDTDGVLGGVGPTEHARDEGVRCEASSVEGDAIDHPNSAVRIALSEGSLSS